MKKLTIGLIIGFIIGSIGISYALRIESVPTFNDLTDKNEVSKLISYLETLRNIVNGKYNLDVVSSVPTWTGKEGDMVAYSSGGVYRLYLYLNSGWRQI